MAKRKRKRKVREDNLNIEGEREQYKYDKRRIKGIDGIAKGQGETEINRDGRGKSGRIERLKQEREERNCNFIYLLPFLLVFAAFFFAMKIS